jgi:hypothetical protein
MTRPSRPDPALDDIRKLRNDPAPLIIMLAMLRVKKPVTQSFLADELKYSHNTIRDALNQLLDAGYVERPHYRRWCLPSGQLHLPGFDGLLAGPRPQLEAGRPQIQARTGSESYPQGYPQDKSVGAAETSHADVSAAETSPCRRFGPYTTTTCIEIKKEHKSSSKVQAETSHADVSQAEVSPRDVSEEQPIDPDLEAALIESGAWRNRWPELISLPWITADYVRAHTAARQAGIEPYDSGNKQTTRFQFHCMLSGDSPPDPDDQPNPTNDRHRYIEGKYSDYIQW